MTSSVSPALSQRIASVEFVRRIFGELPTGLDANADLQRPFALRRTDTVRPPNFLARTFDLNGQVLPRLKGIFRAQILRNRTESRVSCCFAATSNE
jgi:hypothetical protein